MMRLSIGGRWEPSYLRCWWVILPFSLMTLQSPAKRFFIGGKLLTFLLMQIFHQLPLIFLRGFYVILTTDLVLMVLKKLRTILSSRELIGTTLETKGPLIFLSYHPMMTAGDLISLMRRNPSIHLITRETREDRGRTSTS
jgi:hypothetical protein